MSGLCSTLQSLNTNLLSESESEADDVVHTKRSFLVVSELRQRQESTSSDGSDRLFIPRSHDRVRSSSCDGKGLPERRNYFHCRCCGKWKKCDIPNCEDVGVWNKQQHQQPHHHLICDQSETWNRSRDIQSMTDFASRQTDQEGGTSPSAPYMSTLATSPSVPYISTSATPPSTTYMPIPATSSSASYMGTPDTSPLSPTMSTPATSQSPSHPGQPTLISSASMSRGLSLYILSPSSSQSPSRPRHSSPSPSRPRHSSPARRHPVSAETPSLTRDLASCSDRPVSLERLDVKETDGEDNWWESPRESDVDSRTPESVLSFDSDSTGGAYVPIELVPSFIPEAFPRRRQSQSLDRIQRPRNKAWSVEKENNKQDKATVIPQKHLRFHQTSTVDEHVSDGIRSVSDYESRSDTDSPVQHGSCAISSPSSQTCFRTTPESLRTEGKPPIPPSRADTVSNKPDSSQIGQIRALPHSSKNSRLSGTSSARQANTAVVQKNYSRTRSVRHDQSSTPVKHLPPRAPVRMLLVNKSPPSSTFPPASRPRNSGETPPSRPPKPPASTIASTIEREKDQSISPQTDNPPPVPPRGRPPVHPERTGTRVSRQDVRSRRSLRDIKVKSQPSQDMPVVHSIKDDTNETRKIFDFVETLMDQNPPDQKFPPQRPPKSWIPGSVATESNNTGMPPPLPPRARRSQSVDSVFSVRKAGDQHAGMWDWKDGGGCDQRRTASEGDNQKLIVEILV